MNYLEMIKNDPELAEIIDLFCGLGVYSELRELDAKQVYTKVPFAVFGKDFSGGEYGFIGGRGNMPVGYSGVEGQSGKIADSFEDFLKLIIFYPFWKDIMNREYMQKREKIDSFEEAFIDEVVEELDIDYYDVQRAIEFKFSLKRDMEIPERFFNALSSEPHFVTYAAKDGAPSKGLLR